MTYVLDTDILSLLGHEDSPEAPRIRRRICGLRIGPPNSDLKRTNVWVFCRETGLRLHRIGILCGR